MIEPDKNNRKIDKNNMIPNKDKKKWVKNWDKTKSKKIDKFKIKNEEK